MRELSLRFHSSLVSYRSLINRKKALPVCALLIVSIVLLRILPFLDDPSLLNVLLLFLFLSLLEIPRSHPRFLSFFVFFSLCSLMSEGKSASDATYAEKFTKVPTYCLLVAVKCSFDDDEVISSYYTL